MAARLPDPDYYQQYLQYFRSTDFMNANGDEVPGVIFHYSAINGFLQDIPTGATITLPLIDDPNATVASSGTFANGYDAFVQLPGQPADGFHFLRLHQFHVRILQFPGSQFHPLF